MQNLKNNRDKCCPLFRNNYKRDISLNNIKDELVSRPEVSSTLKLKASNKETLTTCSKNLVGNTLEVQENIVSNYCNKSIG